MYKLFKSTQQFSTSQQTLSYPASVLIARKSCYHRYRSHSEWLWQWLVTRLNQIRVTRNNSGNGWQNNSVQNYRRSQRMFTIVVLISLLGRIVVAVLFFRISRLTVVSEGRDDVSKWLDRTNFFVSAVLISTFILLFLLSSSVSLSYFYFAVPMRAARVFGKILVHEFPISYSHTEWNLLSSGTNTLSWWRACYQKLNYIYLFMYFRSHNKHRCWTWQRIAHTVTKRKNFCWPMTPLLGRPNQRLPNGALLF